MPGKYKSDELRKLIVEAKQRGENPAPKSQHPGDEVAESEPRFEPHRAPVADIEAPRRRKKLQQQDRAVSSAARGMEPYTCGHPPRTGGINA